MALEDAEEEAALTGFTLTPPLCVGICVAQAWTEF